MTLDTTMKTIDMHANVCQVDYDIKNPDYSIYLASIGFQRALGMESGIPSNDASDIILSEMSTLAELSQMTTNPTEFVRLYDSAYQNAGYNALDAHGLITKLAGLTQGRRDATDTIMNLTPQSMINLLYDAPGRPIMGKDGDENRPPHIRSVLDRLNHDPEENMHDLRLVGAVHSSGYSNDQLPKTG